MSVVTLKNGELTAAIDAMGAQLTSFALGGKEYLWQADPAVWGKHAPILFPIVGSIRDGKAESAQGEVTLGRHGLARDYEHAVVAQSEGSVTFELADSEETRSAYPYAFKLNMTYELTGPASLTQTFRVENTGDVDLPDERHAVLLPELLDCLGGGTALGRDLEEDLDDVEWGGQSTSSHAGNEAADEILVLVELLLLLGCWGGRKEDVISGG